jgi:hypothetical protein
MASTNSVLIDYTRENGLLGSSVGAVELRRNHPFYSDN